MSITTLSSRELNQDLGRAKRAAHDGPVIITDRGRPVHVLLSYDEYQRIIGQQESLVDRLGLIARRCRQNRKARNDSYASSSATSAAQARRILHRK